MTRCHALRLLAALAGLSLATLLGGPGFAQTAAAPPEVKLDRAQLEKRFATVEVLLHDSSAARQVESSGDRRALEMRDSARELYGQARQAFEAGEHAKSSKLLAEASARMFEAVRLAAPEQVVAAKQRSDFQARLDSVKALHAAQQRIIAEKPGTPGSAEASDTVQRLVVESERLAQGGDLAGARERLDRAYLVAKASVSSMRSGDTLVRSLDFASKEEEYRYEIDRNDTHRMLIAVLLAEKRERAGVDRMVEGFLDRAARLRAEAESASSRGDHAQGVRLLEDSTRELIRAIRGAGVYIPG